MKNSGIWLVIVFGLLACTPSYQTNYLQSNCKQEEVVERADIQKVYRAEYRNILGVDPELTPFLQRQCGNLILVYEKIPPNMFGGRSYIYFDKTNLSVKKSYTTN